MRSRRIVRSILAAAGHDVEVCTTFPSLSGLEGPGEVFGKAWTDRRAQRGSRSVRSYAYIPNPVRSIKRIAHETSFIIGVTLRALMRKRPDVMLVVSPPLGLTAPAILLSHLWGVPYVFDVEDLQPDSAADLDMLPKWAIRFLYRVEDTEHGNSSCAIGHHTH